MSEIGQGANETPRCGCRGRGVHLVSGQPTPLSGLGPLLGQPLGDGTGRLIGPSDRVDVLLLGQEDPADDGPWIAEDGPWERPPWYYRSVIGPSEDAARRELLASGTGEVCALVTTCSRGGTP